MDIVNILEAKIGTYKVVTGTAVSDRYHHIWKMDQPLQAKAVVLPRSTQDVSDVLSICNNAGQRVSVHGGLTNLVGGTETHEDEIVISLEKMNSIEEVDAQSRTLTVQSGVILENIQAAAEAEDLLFPLNFGAKGSAQIGGIISTNAGGLRVFRYGMTRNLVLGLEAVLADGTIISSMKKIIKDNSAYDVKQLFIGSEGTLGIITKAIVRLVESPKSRVSAFVGLSDYNHVVSLLKYMDKGLGGTLSSFELIWPNTYGRMTSPENIKLPLPNDYKYYVLLDSLGNNHDNDIQILESLLEEALDKGLIMDAVLASNQSDLEWFWRIREDVNVIASHCTYDQHFDVSLPIPLIGDYVDNVLRNVQEIDGVEGCYAFGHIADGNIHFIVDKESEVDSLRMSINDLIYEPLQAIGGSVSAEHGIGIHKKAYLHLCRTPQEIQLMKTLKNTLDPNGILNKGKIFD